MVQASFTPPVSAVVAATAATDAPSYFYSEPMDEFTGGIEAVPPPTGPRTIEMSAYSMGAQPACIFSGIDTLSPVVRAQVLAAFQATALSGSADIASGGAPGGAPGGPVIASGTSSAG
ncbi:hypothetical protein CYMTET_18951 [Cymbomonas tetramitiformis]|uniref:Uncharacterized protein n=1 Tax=Cymbomonas tetramitiformis TaxID=36881 RepID=A0AAE0G730_9CHLO|nr:hypothetical protein CYMTET_18951 [Cymbomonas tetramitiformis]